MDDFNGATATARSCVAVSRDRGADVLEGGHDHAAGHDDAREHLRLSVGRPDGTVYVAFVGGYDTKNKNRVGHVYVTKSADDGKTWGPFVLAASPVENPNGLPAEHELPRRDHRELRREPDLSRATST